MAKLNATRGAQPVMLAEFTFNFDDTMENVSGALVDFKTVGTVVVEPINLPNDAVVVGGEVITETAVTGSTAYNISVGDSVSATRYLGATNRVAAGRSALVPTGYRTGGLNIRVTVNPTVAAATAGKVTVRVQYVTAGRVTEVNPN